MCTVYDKHKLYNTKSIGTILFQLLFKFYIQRNIINNLIIADLFILYLIYFFNLLII